MRNNVRTGSASGPTLPVGRSVAGVADFNGDTRPDYLLFNASTRSTLIRYMSGATRIGCRYGPTIPAGFEVAGLADFDGNGRPDYLLGALKYFLADERRRAMAIKRGKGQRFIPLDELGADEGAAREPTDPVTAEQVYERRWASTVLERVLGLLKNEYVAAGNATLFDCLKQLLPDEPGSPV